MSFGFSCFNENLKKIDLHHKKRRSNTGHFAQKTFRTSLLAQVLDRSHNS